MSPLWNRNEKKKGYKILDYFFWQLPKEIFQWQSFHSFFQLLTEISSAKIGQQSWKKILSKVAMLEG